MTVSCPTCGKTTVVEAEVGDFPTHCQCCGGLLRRPGQNGDGLVSACSLKLRQHVPFSGRTERGTLVGLLTSRDDPHDEAPMIIHSRSVATGSTTEKRGSVLRPESRRELARAQVREQALCRAELRGSHQALGALSAVGIGLVVLLLMSALVLKAHAMWGHSMLEHTDVPRALVVASPSPITAIANR